MPPLEFCKRRVDLLAIRKTGVSEVPHPLLRAHLDGLCDESAGRPLVEWLCLAGMSVISFRSPTRGSLVKPIISSFK
jgi:hypothetical protein